MREQAPMPDTPRGSKIIGRKVKKIDFTQPVIDLQSFEDMSCLEADYVVKSIRQVEDEASI